MNIGIDARLLERRMTGIGRYLANFVRNVPACDPDTSYVLFSYRALPEYEAKNVRSVPTIGVPREGIIQKIASPVWLNAVLPYFLKKEKIDTFFAPNSLLPSRKICRENVIAVHDVFHLIDPRFHSGMYSRYITAALARSVQASDRIITISEHSKRDIVRLLHAPAEKVGVAYLAAEDRFRPRTLTKEERMMYAKKYDLPEKFVLYVGVIEERKNIEGIIRIADAIRSETDVAIVLAGRLGHGGAAYVEAIKERQNMRYIGFFDDADLPYLYNLAEVFLFPSRYEGFGLPPLEAMRSGTPVITSNTSSLPEVTGDAVLSFDPERTDEIAKALLGLLNDPEKRSALAARGIVQAKKFSYEKTARTIARLLHGRV